MGFGQGRVGCVRWLTNSVVHDFDLTQRRKDRKERIFLPVLASLRENRELLKLG
jgi:hypothetical protein